MNTSSQLSLRKQRSKVFWVFFILAIPLIILIISYAAGYTFDKQTGTVIPTSSITLSTLPKDATVTLNGTQEKQATPLMKNGVLPGTYTIEIEKKGYLPWKKEVSVSEGHSLVFQDVLLFQSGTPTPAVNTDAELFREYEELIVPLPSTLVDYYRNEGFTTPEQLRVVYGPRDIVIDPLNQMSYILPSVNTFIEGNAIDGIITHAHWNQSTLLYSIQNELWVYYAQTHTHTLLTRQTEPILSTVLHTNGNVALFSINSGIYAIELDDRDYRQLWHIATTPSPTTIQLNKTGNQMIFSSKKKSYLLTIYEQ